MRCELDGKRIVDLDSFITELERSIRGQCSGDVDLGWDLHSLNDHIEGGYGGKPPYHIIVSNAEGAVQSFGHEGLADYCDNMLTVIDKGGRGLVTEEGRDWYTESMNKARLGEGNTLLDELLYLISLSSASIVFLSSSGEVLAEATGLVGE